MPGRYILALDQGTTSSRAILFDREGRIVAQNAREFPQIYPQPGWVEHDPEAIWKSQIESAVQTLHSAGARAEDVAAIGITNQRETTLLWEKATGKPVANAIVWQDRRTAGVCDELKRSGFADEIRRRTGLVTDPYFSATKLKWLLDIIPNTRERAERGELLFGTVDTYLLWRLSGGKLHVTDCSNASRTMLFNICTLQWDEEILRELNIPLALLPDVRASSEVYGHTEEGILGIPGTVPIAGCAGDQQAATFGQTCFTEGQAKNTYGTGCFLLMNAGEKPIASKNNLLTTIGWKIGSKTTYCLEGSVFIAGAAIQYLRDELRIISNAVESESLARSVEDSGGVYFVPAFAGLGAPYWDPYARGAILGLTRGSGRAQIVRAALEAVAYQSRDLLEAMTADCGAPLAELRVDGGMVANNFLMQFQSDILATRVLRPKVAETTALGAAYLAGLAVGFWRDTNEIAANWQLDRTFSPDMQESERSRLYAGWKRAVERALAWETTE